MSLHDPSENLTTQLNNAATVNNAASNGAHHPDLEEESTQTRISRNEAREFEKEIKDNLPGHLAAQGPGAEIPVKVVLEQLPGCTEWIASKTLRQMEKDGILSSRGGKGGVLKHYFLPVADADSQSKDEVVTENNAEQESIEDKTLSKKENTASEFTGGNTEQSIGIFIQHIDQKMEEIERLIEKQQQDLEALKRSRQILLEE